MPTSLKILLCLLASHVLGGCTSFKEAQQKRRIAKAHAVLSSYAVDTPPDKQLADLIEAHPALEGKTVRIVKEHDTIRIAPSTTTATLPVVSTPTGDNALIDSLIHSAGIQLHAKDSTAFAVRLRAELMARPRLSRDTVTRHIGPITLQLWTDAHGRPQAKVVKTEQKVAYEKEVHQTGPIIIQKEMTAFERIWLFVKDATGFVVVIVVLSTVGLLIFYFKRRSQTQS